MNLEPTNWLTTRIVMFIARHTPKCHDITRLISQEQDGALPWSVRVKMRLHYVICVWCARYRDQLGFMRQALHVCPEELAKLEAPGLPPDANERMKRTFRA